MFKISSLIVGNQTCESLPCESDINCTLDGFLEERDHCLPQIVKDYRVPAIINLVLVIIVGGLGNLLTIIAICAARIRYFLSTLNKYQALSVKSNEQLKNLYQPSLLDNV